MRVGKVLLLAVALLAPTVLTGCISSVSGAVDSAQDWWNGEGTIQFRIGTLDATASGQHMADFSEVKIAVRSVAVYPVREVVTLTSVQYDRPFGIDLRMRYEEDRPVSIFQDKVPAKTVERITTSIALVQVTDSDGNRMPRCGGSVKGTPEQACIAIAPGGLYELNLEARPTALERGGTTVFTLPLVVNHDEESNEYFIQARDHESEAPVEFR